MALRGGRPRSIGQMREKRQVNVAAALIVAADFAMMLTALTLALPPASYAWPVLAPHVAAALVMVAFGPYLLAVANCRILVATLAVVHLVLICLLVRRVRAFDALGRWSRRARLLAAASAALAMALAIGCEFPVVERHVIVSDKIKGDSVRLAVVSDLHSCAYGDSQLMLSGEISAAEPDAVLFVGDIFDDRLPDDKAQALVMEVAKRHPCFYVSGNHEYWSERVAEMKAWLRKASVTVLEGSCQTLTAKGTAIDICGVDDPTYMSDDEWLWQLHRADRQSDPNHVRILLSHRPERVPAYEKFAFDLVLTGHAHGGQWLIPFVGRGGYSPDQHFFPKYVDGRYTLANGSELLVSRGLARESTPLPRLFNPPEIMIVELAGPAPIAACSQAVKSSSASRHP